MSQTVRDTTVALPRSDEGGASAFSRQLRNSELLEVIAGGCALFFAFVGVFSFVSYRLEAPPFGLAPTATGLIFLLWGMGTLSPTAGNLAHRVGWRPVLICTLTVAAGALLLSLAAAMLTLIPALALLAPRCSRARPQRIWGLQQLASPTAAQQAPSISVATTRREPWVASSPG